MHSSGLGSLSAYSFLGPYLGTQQTRSPTGGPDSHILIKEESDDDDVDVPTRFGRGDDTTSFMDADTARLLTIQRFCCDMSLTAVLD